MSLRLITAVLDVVLSRTSHLIYLQCFNKYPMVHIAFVFFFFFFEAMNHSIKELILKTIAWFSLTTDLIMMLESSVTKSFIV